MLKLVWTVAIIMQAGPAVQDVQEGQKFANKAACDEYASAHVDRMADWTRGVLRAPFEFPVKVVWRCEAEDRPA